MKTARRVLVASGIAAASLFAVPAVAGAADPGCYAQCAPPHIASTSDGPTTSGSALPFTSPDGPSSGSSSSLPFTGTDVVELAAIGGAAVLAGGLLSRRRRAHS